MQADCILKPKSVWQRKDKDDRVKKNVQEELKEENRFVELEHLMVM